MWFRNRVTAYVIRDEDLLVEFHMTVVCRKVGSLDMDTHGEKAFRWKQRCRDSKGCQGSQESMERQEHKLPHGPHECLSTGDSEPSQLSSNRVLSPDHGTLRPCAWKQRRWQASCPVCLDVCLVPPHCERSQICSVCALVQYSLFVNVSGPSFRPLNRS